MRKQLLAYATSHEITKKVEKSHSLSEVYESLCLGFHDLANYGRVMILGIDEENFCFKPLSSIGFNEESIKDFRAGLSFLSGEYADAVFLNKHILVDELPDGDCFSQLDCKGYIVFPLLSQITDNCWEIKNCGKTECVCYNTENSYCWATPKAGCAINAQTEDDHRKACIKCPLFKCRGLLWLDLTGRAKSAEEVAITGEDTAMISAVLSQAGLMLSSILAHEELSKNNEILSSLYDKLKEVHHRLEMDLQQANSIQKQLLPSSFPQVLTDVATFYKSNLEVGGDYYDCFELENGNIGMVVADVSGHGTAAAMMMSMFKMLLKTSPLNSINPSLCLREINKVIVKEMDSEKFITVFYAIFNPMTRTLEYTNAGHIAIPLLNKKTGEIELLNTSGLFIGMLPELSLKNTIMQLEEPHRLLLYTDGLNEANNHEKEQYGHENVYKILKDTSDKKCQEVIDNLANGVEKFQNGKEFFDDITIFACDL
ncbi:hypothetical protein AGMMS49938_17940 [Fibrobacterales bacterium]|nr:hypothetical protein AGMMS49938_17940 [Fibrobacterales bacterium]